MSVHAIINLQAGSALGGGTDDLQRLLQETYRRHCAEIGVEAVEPQDLESAIAEALEPGIEVLVVAGGDGTIRSAASALIGTDVALGIIPLGTFNRLGRELGIPLDPQAAVEALVAGREKQIDVARLNGRLFLCNSLIGLPVQFSEERQALRGRSLTERINGYLRAMLTILSSRRRIRISIDDGEDKKVLRVLSLAVSNNPYDSETGFGLQRRSFDSGRLGLYASSHHSAVGTLWLALRALLGLWPEESAFEYAEARRLVIESNRRKIKLSNDGEVEYLAPPLKYSIEPKALRVIVPA